MHVHNVHRRAIDVTPQQLGALIDGLAGPGDRLWPADRWPAMRLDRPLQVGARGGHGPIRYWVEHYEPGQRVRFRFVRPRGLDGFHELHLVTSPDHRSPELVHVLDARLHGLGRLSWPLVYRPLHDALLEDALDNAERECTGTVTTPTTWRPRVRRLRRLLARRTSRPRTIAAV